MHGLASNGVRYPSEKPAKIGMPERFDLLSWLAEPKTDRARFGAAFGCLGAAAFGIPLAVIVLAFGAIPHCKTCASQTSGNLLLALGAAALFGVLAGTAAVLARDVLRRLVGKTGTIVALAIAIAAAAYVGLQPVLTLITAS